VAKPELGTKRLCPNCGAKYYDLNHDPIVCPRCGTPFEVTNVRTRAQARQEAAAPDEEVEDEAEQAEFVTLEEADEESADSGAVAIEGEDDEEIEAGDDEDDTFLAEEEDEEEDDVSGIIGDVDEEEG